jgi:hypothetical protein
MSKPKPQNISVDELELSELILSEKLRLLGYQTYYGRVIGLGLANDQSDLPKRSVLIVWDKVDGTINKNRVTGNISDEQWEILKIAYAGSGRIITISNKQNGEWQTDLSLISTSKYGD